MTTNYIDPIFRGELPLETNYADPVFRGELPSEKNNLYDIINYYQNLASPPPTQRAATAAEFTPSNYYGLSQFSAPRVSYSGRTNQAFLPILERGKTYVEPAGSPSRFVPNTSNQQTSGRTFTPFSLADLAAAERVSFPTGAEAAAAARPATPVTPVTPPSGSDVSGGGDGGGFGGGFGDAGGGGEVGPGPSASDVGNTIANTVNSMASNPALAVVDPVSFVIATIAQNAMTPSLVAPEDAAPITTATSMTPSEAQAQANAAAVAAAEAAAQANAQAEADAAAAMAGHFGFGYGDAGEGGPSSGGGSSIGGNTGSVGAEGATSTGGMGPGDTGGTGNVGGGGTSSGASSSGMGGASEGSAGSTAADASSPDGPDGSNASADGGGGGGGGSKIICTKLYQLGLLAEDIYLADQAFGAKLVKTNPDIYNGYRAWAEIVVDWMSGDGPNMMPWLSEKRRREISQSWSTSWAKEIATPWAEEMAYKMGVKEFGNTTGKLITAAGIPICKAVGVWQRVFGPSKKPAGFGKGAMLIPVFILFKLTVKLGRLIEGKKAPSLQGT